MSRGQGAKTARLKSIWLLTLCVSLCISCWQTAALATDSGDQQGVGPASRPWENYFGVAILSNDRTVVVGDKGVVMTSPNRGSTWTRIQLTKDNIYNDLYSLAFTPDGSRGWAVGDGGSIFRTDDRGSTWKLQTSGQSAALLKIAVVDAQRACAVGEHGLVLCTDDAGAHWNTQKFEDLVFFDVVFTDSNHGWAVGEFSTTIRTIDGGKTWSVQTGAKRIVTLDPYFAIVFKNAADGLVLGLNGIDMQTRDGGNTWQAGTLPDQHRSFYAAVAAPANGSNVFYVGGEDGITARVIDDNKVVRTDTVTSNSITSIAFSSNFGIAIGLSGTVMRSEDGGQNWIELQGSQLVETRAQTGD
jgi:photosystem II stability/assembly factor-like uncharacterized protein